MSHLVPEVRVNKNGVPVLKHVRPDGAGTAASRGSKVPAASVARASTEVRAAEAPRERFNRVQQANYRFEGRAEPTTIDRDGLLSFTQLVRRMSDTDEEGDTRIWSATNLIKTGDHLGARSILALLDEPGMDPQAFTIIDVWTEAADAGVIERNRLYLPGDPSGTLFSFLAGFFIEAKDEWSARDASEDDYRELAIIHEAVPELEAADLAAFCAEHGDIDASVCIDAFGASPALSSGAI